MTEPSRWISRWATTLVSVIRCAVNPWVEAVRRIIEDYRRQLFADCRWCPVTKQCTVCYSHVEKKGRFQGHSTLCEAIRLTDGAFVSDVESVVKQLVNLNVETIVVRGGDPFLAMDRLMELRAAVLRRSRLTLVVASSGIARATDEILDFLDSPRVRLLLILFGPDAETTHAVTRCARVHAAQRALLDGLQERRLAFHATMLLTEATRERHEEIAEWWRQRWNVRPQLAECYDREVLRGGGRFVIAQPGAKRLAPWISSREFFWRLQNKPCLYGQFEIDFDGRIRPCPGLPDVCGEIRNGDLRGALSDRILYDHWWSMDKSRVEPCMNCGLRFACNDCASIEMLGAADPGIKRAYCSYDPDSDERALDRAWSPPDFVKVLTA